MKATDFDLSKDLKLSLESGVATFHDSRLLIFDASAIGLLRQSLLEELGWERTREMYLRFGFQHGYSDHMQMRLNYDFESEFDLMRAGPLLHRWKGIVQPAPTKFEVDRNAGTFFATGIWHNSYEAEQYLSYNDIASEPACWSLAGYATGYQTAFFGKPVLTIETHCVAKGDPHCAFIGKPASEFGDEAALYRRALASLWKPEGDAASGA
jgi:rsbT co-antagonist protein RsbR